MITSVVTNRTFLVKCHLVRAKRSLSRHYQTASTEIVIWPTKHLLLTMLEFRFAKFRGICSFQICTKNVTNLVSQLSCSNRFRYLRLAWLGLLGSAWVGMVSLGFKQDPQRPTTGVKPGISDQRQKGHFEEPCHTTLNAHPQICIYIHLA